MKRGTCGIPVTRVVDIYLCRAQQQCPQFCTCIRGGEIDMDPWCSRWPVRSFETILTSILDCKNAQTGRKRGISVGVAVVCTVVHSSG
jgi:hypothetical protein